MTVSLFWTPHTVTVVTRTPGPPDLYGEATETETTTTAVAYLQPLPRVFQACELIVNRDTIIVDWEGFFPPDVSLTGTSAVTWEGVTFEVIGAPQRWDDGAGSAVYQQVRLRRISG